MSSRMDMERGATLLSVLVIVMLMSAAAIAAIDALTRSVLVSKSSSARAETFWTARGATDAAASYLTKALSVNEGVLNSEADLFTQPVTLPAGHGIVVLQAREASNCFNLNALVDDAGDDGVGDDSLTPYQNLLIALGMNDGEAESLAQKLADWIDPDFSTRTYGAEDGYYASQSEPYRAANSRLRSVSELKTIAGYDDDVRARIDGLVCLRPGTGQAELNINTLTEEQAPLLVALFSQELSADDARSLIASRPAGGWLDVETFLKEDAVNRIAPDARHEAAVSVASTFLSADVNVGIGDLVTNYQALFQRTEGGNVSFVSMARRDF